MLRVAAAFLLLFWSSTAFAAKRVALVVGNSTYKHAGELANPKNDATDIASMLRQKGFQVLEGIDLDRAGFDGKLREFGAVVKDAGVAVFFFAGHGLQVSGRNYLLPIDAQLATAGALAAELVPLDLVLRTMATSTGFKIVFLDACRNNPLASTLPEAFGALRRGLAPAFAGADNMVISFSAQPGNVALDGEGHNSPFTKALVKHIGSDADLLSMLSVVRKEVANETQNKQIPWDHSSLQVPYHFNRDMQPPPVTEATVAWSRLNRGNLIALDDFVRRFPLSPEAEKARERMTMIPLCMSFRGSRECITPVVGRERQSISRHDRKSFTDCPNCPEMVLVPWGHFNMGSPADEAGRQDGEEQVRLILPVYFTVARFAVTQDQWHACVSEGGCRAAAGNQEKQSDSAAGVTFEDAKSYVKWLSAKTGGRYRLPSEAEWEFVIRAGTTTAYWWGSTMATRPAPNSDNPWTIRSTGPEWVEDCWNERNGGMPRDGRARVTGDCSRRVVRGSPNDDPASLRSAYRSHATPSTKGIGFRVIREFEY